MSESSLYQGHLNFIYKGCSTTVLPVWCAESLASMGGAWEVELLTKRQASSISKRLTASIPIFSATETYQLQKVISKLNQHQHPTSTPNKVCSKIYPQAPNQLKTLLASIWYLSN